MSYERAIDLWFYDLYEQNENFLLGDSVIELNS